MESVGATRAEDTLAIDIYRRAEESGDEITLRTMERRLSELLSHEPGCTKLNEADSGQPSDDRTAIDVYERDKYSEDHPEHRDGDGDAPEGSPIEHDATLTDRCERAVLFRSRDTSRTRGEGHRVPSPRTT